MLKVLIVDDEFIVREGLKVLINWEEFNMYVAFEASNGKDALKIIHDHDVDVVITDIRMPLMDGMELTKIVKEDFGQIKVILLTCYNDFEYVQDAIQLGASGYLLKTDLEDGNIEKQLLKISKEIENDRASSETFKELAVKAEKSSFLLQEKQIKSILQDEFSGFLTLDELKWLHKLHLVVKMRFNRLNCPIEIIKEEIQNLFAEDLSITFQLEAQTLLTVISFPEIESDHNFLKWEERLMDQLSLKIAGFSEEHSIYYVRCDHVDSLYDQYKLLRNVSINHRFYHGYGILLNVEEYFQSVDPLAYTVDTRKLNELTILRNWDKVKKLCESSFAFYESVQLDSKIVQMNVITMIDTIMVGLQSNANLLTSSWGSNRLEFNGKVKEILCFQELKEWFLNGFDQLEENRLIFIGGMNEVVKRAALFIEVNYYKEITLEDLSEETSLSQSYLSTIFKKVTGQSFIEYLNHLRIEKAKQLLLTSTLKVFEVSEKVGFNDPKYFSKRFKRITGVSPNDYKNNHVNIV